MEPSRELRGLMLAFYRDWSMGDTSGIDLFSDSDDMTLVGSDPVEWYRGGPGIKAMFTQQFEELGTFDIAAGDLWAFAHGDAGWVVDNPVFTFAEGLVIRPRCTAICVREAFEWKIVHWHVSVGASNEETLGKSLTTTIDELADWAEGVKPDLGAATSAQGTVTIAFTDMEASTATNEALGDDVFVPLLLKHNDIVLAQTRAAEGEIVKSQGDGFMLAFPSARRAVECLISVQREVQAMNASLRVRMGLHTGEPTRHRDDFYGRDVAYAARLGAAARGGEILVSELVRSLVEPSGSVAFDGPRSLDLKGFEGPQPVYAVRWTD